VCVLITRYSDFYIIFLCDYATLLDRCVFFRHICIRVQLKKYRTKTQEKCKMIGELALGAWLCLVGYIIWFFALSKDYVPLTGKETTLLWKLHKKQTHCSSTKFETVRHKNKVVGFRCACGYEYLSKRLITQRDRRARALDVSRKNARTHTSQEEPVYLERYE